MNFRFHVVTCSIMIVVGACAVLAQEPADTVGSLPGIEIETAVDRAESYIGDRITYTLTITYDSTYDLTPPPLGANLGAFDVKDYQPDIESRLPDGRLQSKTIFKLSTYTTGDYIIPPLPVVFRLPDGSRKLMLAEPVPIKILSLLDMVEGDTVDIKPLKPQLAAEEVFPPDYTAYYWWGGGGLLVILLIVAGIWYWLWRKRRQLSAEDLRDPWEVAFERLAFVKVEYLDRPLGDQERAGAYYVELTELVRAYLGRIYNVDVLEMTTEQFMTAFSDIDLPSDQFELLGGFFKHADMVKFAQFIPERKRCEDDFLMAHDLVERVRADFQQQQDMQSNTEMSVLTEPAPRQTEESNS